MQAPSVFQTIFKSSWVVPLALSVALSLIPGGQYALYPFKLFTTWVHECCHAGVAVLVGGKVSRITLSPDTTGLTHYRVPSSRVRQGLVTSAGYLGASLFGCALYALSVSRLFRGQSAKLEIALGLGLLLSALIWIRGFFGLLTVMLLGAGLICLGEWGPRTYSEPFLAFLAVQTGLNAVLDIRVLFNVGPHAQSDAHAMQKLFWMPAIFWALLWLGLSVALTFWTVSEAGVRK